MSQMKIFYISYMSKLLHQTQNIEALNQSNGVEQYLLNFIKDHNGGIISCQPFVNTFQLSQKINQCEPKRVVVYFQKRKNSFKFSFHADININKIPGGVPNLLKIIDCLNNKVLHENNLYTYNDPNIFILRCILEKQTISNRPLKQYTYNFLSQSLSQFIQALEKIYNLGYQQSYNSNKIKQTIDTINIARVVYQKKLKQKASEERHFHFQNFYGPNTKVITEKQREVTQQQLRKFQYHCKKIKQQFYKISAQKPIVNKIKMLKESVDKNWKAPDSSNGYLQKVRAQFIVFCSLNEATSQLLVKLLNEQKKQQSYLNKQVVQLHRKSSLVRKSLKLNESCLLCKKFINPECQCYMKLKSYENEVQALSYIRNLNTYSVASYFFGGDYQSNNEIVKNTILYSQYYPKCLSTERIKAKEVLPTILKILEGLQKLHTICLIHRDLKPNNILIDSKNMPKIIDFGSAWVFQNNQNIQNNLCPSLFTTKKYNLYFQEALFAEKYKMTEQQFERHQLYDMHAVGVIMRELYSDPEVSSQLGILIQTNLNWLSSRCCSHNPNLRLDAENAFYICGLLLKLWNNKCQNFITK